MDKIEIDLNKIEKLNLSINEYLTLLKIYLKTNNKTINYLGSKKDLEHLNNLNFIRYQDGEISVLTKSKQLFSQYEETIDFDELFNIYPLKTPDGRVLRTEKDRAGKITLGYKNNKARYLRKIKNTEDHNDIVKVTERMLKHQEARGGLKYLNALEAYINGSLWEKYFYLLDKREEGYSNNTNKL